MAKGYIDPIEVIRENIENIFISSLYVSELKPYQLEEIISYEKTRKRILLKKYGLDGSVMLSGIDFFMEADPTMEDYQKWVTAEQMETIVKAEQQRRKGEAPTRTQTAPVSFESLFAGPKEKEEVLRVCEDVGIIKRKDGLPIWSYGGKVGAIVILWDVLRLNSFLINEINSDLAIDAIAKEFGITVSKRARSGTPAYREALIEKIRKSLEPE